jgi:hypothetical protein
MVLQIALRDIGQLTDLGIMAGDQHLGAADPPSGDRLRARRPGGIVMIHTPIVVNTASDRPPLCRLRRPPTQSFGHEFELFLDRR